MRITGWRLIVLAFVMSVVGLTIITAYPATKTVVGGLVIGVLTSLITWEWYTLYRRRNTTRRTVVCVGGGVWVIVGAAMWAGAETTILWTLLCAAIANGAANVLYGIHLKRAGGF